MTPKSRAVLLAARAGPRRKWHFHWPDTAPSARERALLQLIAEHGGLHITFTRSGKKYSCDDGTPVQTGRYRSFGDSDFAKAVELHWLEPDPAGFPEAAAQRYLMVRR
jgi:hypothetical protein